jgi:hypothetical protein
VQQSWAGLAIYGRAVLATYATSAAYRVAGKIGGNT